MLLLVALLAPTAVAEVAGVDGAAVEDELLALVEVGVGAADKAVAATAPPVITAAAVAAVAMAALLLLLCWVAAFGEDSALVEVEVEEDG